MPHNCYDCDLHNYHECDLTSESIEEDYCWNGDSREKHCPLREVEAILKSDYENRLKAEKIAMLAELQTEIEELYPEHQCSGELTGFADAIETITPIIQQKIDKLKGNKNGNK